MPRDNKKSRCSTSEHALMLVHSFSLGVLFLLVMTASSTGQVLQTQLTAEGPADLADAARRLGDAQRGTVVFYQQHMACTNCHVAGSDQSPLGPDLSRLGKDSKQHRGGQSARRDGSQNTSHEMSPVARDLPWMENRRPSCYSEAGTTIYMPPIFCTTFRIERLSPCASSWVESSPRLQPPQPG